MNYRRHALIKHAWRQVARVPRACARLTAGPEAYRRRPPVLVNSFPKSGTHLLLQILSVLPGLRDWGQFWASQPSFLYRERSAAAMAARIRAVAPAELVCGHLHFSLEVAQALAARHVSHFFIYRDPRDVVVSEAHYLASMNRWHRLHDRFRRLPSPGDRLLLSIRGLPDERIQYPDIARRFGRFLTWIGRDDVCAIRYEDLMSDRREEEVARILRFYRDHSNADLDLTALHAAALAAIQPQRSHTFRQGGSGGWRREFDGRARDAFRAVAADLLVRLGYERSPEW